jgi:hypothetical protein
VSDVSEIDTTKMFVHPVRNLGLQVRPTNTELKILQVLWRRGRSTVREVQQELGGGSGYTTVL